MKLLSFEVQTVVGRFERIGALAYGRIVDLSSSCFSYLMEAQGEGRARAQANALVPPEMIGFLEGDAASRRAADLAVEYVGERLRRESQPLGPDGERLTFDESEVRWLPPVPRPPMVRDGVLLLDHYRSGMERLFKFSEQERVPAATSRMPIYWKCSRASVAGHQAPIRWPKYTEKLDYEFELGMYVGRRGKDIPLDEAGGYIAGYTIFNDLGCRDIQVAEMSMRLGPTKSKDFETSKIMGPYLVTADELPSVDGLGMWVRVNGEAWYEGRISGFAFTFPEVIAYVSRDETLYPGDFFASGPPAMSAGFEIDRWIKPGDRLECEIEGLGVLSNRVVRE